MCDRLPISGIESTDKGKDGPGSLMNSVPDGSRGSFGRLLDFVQLLRRTQLASSLPSGPNGRPLRVEIREHKEVAMSDVDEFVAAAFPRLKAADLALHNGDARPRGDTWSDKDPVTLFGAAVTKKGWDDLSKTFEWLASRFSNCTSMEHEVIAAGASGDLAYLLTIEHTSVSIDARPTSYSLRVTQIFRREDGEWKIVHRHADPVQDTTSSQEERLDSAAGVKSQAG